MLKLVCLFAIISVAYAALSRFPPQEKPAEFAKQEGCYIDQLNRVLPYEEPFYPDQSCEKYVCQKSNGETRSESCGAVFIRPECRKTEDLSKHYPDCCPMEVCD